MLTPPTTSTFGAAILASSLLPMTDAEALQKFLQQKPSSQIISHLSRKAREVIRCDPPTNLPQSPPRTPDNSRHTDFSQPRQPTLPPLEDFIQNLITRSHVEIPTLMCSLVYLHRLKSKLPPVAKGMRCTVHRIFLASLILAAKYLNDASPKNRHWARYSTCAAYDNFGFSLTEVNLMEKQLLFLLDWDLRIEESDLYHHFAPFLNTVKESAAREQKIQLFREREKEVREREFTERVRTHHHHHQTSPYPYPSPCLTTPPLSHSRSNTPASSSGRSSRSSHRHKRSITTTPVSRNEYPAPHSGPYTSSYSTPPSSAPSSMYTHTPELGDYSSASSGEDVSPLVPQQVHAMPVPIPSAIAGLKRKAPAWRSWMNVGGGSKQHAQSTGGHPVRIIT